jgi:hypothetical protein
MVTTLCYLSITSIQCLFCISFTKRSIWKLLKVCYDNSIISNMFFSRIKMNLVEIKNNVCRCTCITAVHLVLKLIQDEMFLLNNHACKNYSWYILLTNLLYVVFLIYIILINIICNKFKHSNEGKINAI